MKKDANTADTDILHDLDQIKGLAGKEWSVELAKKMGLSAAEIELYLSQKNTTQK